MTDNKQRHHRVACPNCAAQVTWSSEQPWRPFCSERCRLIDLGSWLDESNRIPAEQQAPAAPTAEDDSHF
jgi:endogenous inhibitor of DNA gyrase (YacG/DUF329 family)